MNRWSEVGDWLNRLRTLDAADFQTGLSPEGARAAWKVALDALSPEALAVAQGETGVPWRTATFVAARTVFTAPLEWLALLLGQGTAVRWKVARGARPTAEAVLAVASDLPLFLQEDRTLSGEAVFAMGADATLQNIQTSLPNGTQFYGFGNRYSVAYADQGWAALAEDLAYYDGRGCFSPVAVFSDAPDAAERLADALTAIQSQLPLGEVSDAEHAAIRSRRALARVTGSSVEGDGWSIHQLPFDHWVPQALPRSVALLPHLPVQDLLQRFPWLSTVGTDHPVGSPLSGVRVCALGRMQKPELLRFHDGVWLPGAVRRR